MCLRGHRLSRAKMAGASSMPAFPDERSSVGSGLPSVFNASGQAAVRVWWLLKQVSPLPNLVVLATPLSLPKAPGPLNLAEAGEKKRERERKLASC